MDRKEIKKRIKINNKDMHKFFNTFILPVMFMALAFTANAQDNNVIDEVVWVVGDEAILKSEVEDYYRSLQYSGEKIDGDPYCVLPERIAIQKLFLHQAKLDSIEVNDAVVLQQVDAQINYYILNFYGSKEKMEEYQGKTMAQIREELTESVRNNETVNEMKKALVKDIKITPSDVRRYFSNLPADSIPYIPTQVEVQILSVKPRIPQQEIDNIKSRLREYTDRINKGDADFSTLAIMYSQDPGSARMGGEMGFKGKAEFVPEFAKVAFSLNDPKKVSKIVETEYGYHIIQLIEKRGDRVNVRHILLRPEIAQKDLDDAVNLLDTLRTDIIDKKKFTFEEAALHLSQDKDTRNNYGLMVNKHDGTTKFEMGELPQDVAKVVDKMNVGDISKPFEMVDETNGKEVVAIVKLKSRTLGHRANIGDDYQALKAVVEKAKQDELIEEWIKKKQKETYVRIKDGWNNCEFKYDGWLKK